MNGDPAHNVAWLLARTARVWPAQPALACGHEVVADYRALAGRAARIAFALRKGGLVAGDRAVLVGRNSTAWIEALLGCWWSGAMAVPVNAKLHPKELAYVLADSGARWVFADDTWSAALGADALAGTAVERVVTLGGSEFATLRTHEEAPLAPRAFEDPAWLFYTSGTTGRPKGVMITHGNLLAMAQCFLSDVEPVAAGDAILHPAPLSHGSGLYLVPHVLAGAVSVVPESGGFAADEVASLLDRWSGALFFAAPTMLKRLLARAPLSAACLAHLKTIVCGGAPLYVADARQAVDVLGPRLAQIYGQGESPMTITALPRTVLARAVERNDEARLASVGVAQSGVALRIGSVEHPQTAGDPGEVLVRGPTVMRGYWNHPEATAATLAHGWLHTGDVGSVDASGFLTLMDRVKDLIISGGANIYPREIEEVLLRHAAVVEAAVVGAPHAEWGEEVIACVVTGAGADTTRVAAELDALCLANVARFKRPRRYAFLPELPKNETGKVLKRSLREQLAQAR